LSNLSPYLLLSPYPPCFGIFFFAPLRPCAFAFYSPSLAKFKERSTQCPGSKTEISPTTTVKAPWTA
jgi:hypothetical protein